MTDIELLRKYVRTGCEEAFAQVVRQHIDIVYSAARRQVNGDSNLAEEVTQRVFILLAKKARKLDQHVFLGGWLFNAVRFIARDVLRKEQRRAVHEQKAAQIGEAMRNAASPSKDDPWDQAEVVLDEAMSSLGEQTRGLLVLKFFQGLTAREVGERLGISEEAARKRVSRAVDELRELFLRKGVTMSAAGLAEALAMKAVIKAPAALAASSTSAATSAATSGSSILKGILVASTKVKVTAAVIAIAAMSGASVTGVKVYQHFTAAAPVVTVAITKYAPPARQVVDGVVRDSAGQPLVGAEVMVAAQQLGQVSVYSNGRNPPAKTTGGDGKFSIEVPGGIYELVVRSPQGFAEVSGRQLEKSTDISIRPWGRLEGIVIAGAKPAANVKVGITRIHTGEDRYAWPVDLDAETKTDDAGHFTFEKVAPGETWVWREQHRFQWQAKRYEYVVVDSGKKSTVKIGGAGRPIMGRFVAPPGAVEPIVWARPSARDPKTQFEATLRMEVISMSSAQHKPDETPEEHRAAEEAYGRTVMGKYAKAWWLSWNFEIDRDGTFRIEDVPPGMYNLMARSLELDPKLGFLEDVARATKGVMVPPVPGGRSSDPIDVGNIEVTLVTRYKTGQPAPSFDFVATDGKTHKLSDHFGKHLLIVFFQPPQEGPTEDWFSRQMTAFKTVGEQYKDKIEILWVDPYSHNDLRAAAEKYQLGGVVGAVADYSDVEGYGPSLMGAVLIDPAGKIVHKHLFQRNIREIVDEAMGKAAPEQSL